MIAFIHKKKKNSFRLELAFIFRAFEVRHCGQTEVYFRDIIFLQKFSELTISLLLEKNKVDPTYRFV